MFKTSDNVLFAVLFFLFSAVPAFGQDLNYRIDPAAYLAAKSVPEQDVYLYVRFEPPGSFSNQNSVVVDLHYVKGRPSGFETISRIGFVRDSINVDTRYILADGADLVLVNAEQNSTVLTKINAALSSFGLATVSERLAAIQRVMGQAPSVPVNPVALVDLGGMMPQMLRMIVPFVLMGLGCALSLLVVRVGLSRMFKASGPSGSKYNSLPIVHTMKPLSSTVDDQLNFLAQFGKQEAIDGITEAKNDYTYRLAAGTSSDDRVRNRQFLRSYVLAKNVYNIRASSREEQLLVGQFYDEFILERDKAFIEYWYDAAFDPTVKIADYDLDVDFRRWLRRYQWQTP